MQIEEPLIRVIILTHMRIYCSNKGSTLKYKYTKIVKFIKTRRDGTRTKKVYRINWILWKRERSYNVV